MSGGPGSTSVERNTKKDFTPKQNEKIRFYRAESIVTKGRMPPDFITSERFLPISTPKTQ
jgi:hypothetical protein